MKLPFFYKNDLNVAGTITTLDEPTSKHIVQVLRMQKGELVQITDGKGALHKAEIADDNRKKCVVNIIETIQAPANTKEVTIAISLLKNINRFEWFLEKATEIGVSIIVPLICERTEKIKAKTERWNGILISAMLQSQQAWLPTLLEPQKYPAYVTKEKSDNKYIAHCIDETDKTQLNNGHHHLANSAILIGPEGDFTQAEILMALEHKFCPVALGNTRLRTETAGIVAATLLCNI